MTWYIVRHTYLGRHSMCVAVVEVRALAWHRDHDTGNELVDKQPAHPDNNEMVIPIALLVLDLAPQSKEVQAVVVLRVSQNGSVQSHPEFV